MTTILNKIETLRTKANKTKSMKNRFYYYSQIIKLEQEIKDFN